MSRKGELWVQILKDPSFTSLLSHWNDYQLLIIMNCIGIHSHDRFARMWQDNILQEISS